MKIQEIISVLESVAPPSLQENYDNAVLLIGNNSWDCTGIITTLDATEAVVQEAIDKGCNLVVAHHPIIFGGLRKITGKNYVMMCYNKVAAFINSFLYHGFGCI